MLREMVMVDRLVEESRIFVSEEDDKVMRID